MRYRMLGIDLDGTLFDSNARISHHNREAVTAAQREGVLCVPCTGRGWIESNVALADLSGLSLGVFVGGAAVVDVTTGQLIDWAAFEPHVAIQVIEYMDDLPEAVLVFRDANLVGHDYLVTGRGDLSDNTRWWFQHNNIRVYHQRRVTEDDLHHALRIGCVAGRKRIAEISARVQKRMGDLVFIQNFEGVQKPDLDQSIHILEIFATGVDKWRGLGWIAQQQDIDPSQIAVIGDEINDVAMLQAAGCGIAMANATDQVKQAADHITLANDEDGVAHAIAHLLAGDWE